MNTVPQRARTLLAMLALGFTVAAVSASVVQAGPSVPAGFSAQQWKASQVRSEALNRQYHLGAYSRSKVDDRAALRALMLRSDALNQKYHLGRYAVPAARTGSRFDWGDAGIGAAAAFGLVLVALGLTAIITRRSRGPRPSVAA